MNDQVKRANRKLVWLFLLLVLLMFGFGFALVPLYDVFCKITGLNGKTNTEAVEIADFNPGDIDTSRSIDLQFTVTQNEQMPWEFQSNISGISIHPGQIHSISYHAKNPTDQAMTVQAIPSVSPAEAAAYLKKIVCFCFNSQFLDAQAETDMEVRFYIDHALPKHIETMTLSYTLFDITRK